MAHVPPCKSPDHTESWSPGVLTYSMFTKTEARLCKLLGWRGADATFKAREFLHSFCAGAGSTLWLPKRSILYKAMSEQEFSSSSKACMDALPLGIPLYFTSISASLSKTGMVAVPFMACKEMRIWTGTPAEVVAYASLRQEHPRTGASMLSVAALQAQQDGFTGMGMVGSGQARHVEWIFTLSACADLRRIV